MKTALYIGDHAGDTLVAQLGRWVTVHTQTGDNKIVSHVEAIHGEASDGSVTIASASIRDGACVRTRSGVILTRANWRIVDVPAWSLLQSREWFWIHDEEPYDWRGAWATRMPGRGQAGHWFCNQAVGASVGLQQPHTFGPAHYATIALSFGQDVTEDFFAARGGLA